MGLLIRQAGQLIYLNDGAYLASPPRPVNGAFKLLEQTHKIVYHILQIKTPYPHSTMVPHEIIAANNNKGYTVRISLNQPPN